MATTYEFGPYRLDVARRRLSLADGTAVAATGRVFDTLAYLVANAGRLVDKRELMDAVWGRAVVEENNLTQAVSTIRQLLGERPNDARYIVTVPGRGYQFVAPVRAAAGPASGAEPSPGADPAPVPGAGAAPAAPPAAAWRTPRLALAVAGIAVFVVAALWLLRAPPTPPAGSLRTVAILPFKPLVAESSDPALELGMAETMITRLSRVPGLVVSPLSSVRKYGTLDQDPVQAGRELGADVVLDASIQRIDDALRVTTRLVRVEDGTAIWTDQVDESWTGIFAMQDRIAERVVAGLALELTREQRSRLTRHETRDNEAYRLFTLGRYHYLKLTPPEIDRGIGYLERAVALDPAYSTAHAALAEAYRALAITSDRRPGEVMPVGKAAAQRALDLDPNSASAQASLCFIQVWWDWDWEAAEQSCRRAVALDPASADGPRAYAVLLSDLGRHDAAIAQARRAAELEPLSLITRAIEGHVLLYAGRHAEAVANLAATLELEPRFWIARLFLGKAYLAQGRLPEALAEFEAAREYSLGNSEAVSLVGYTRARMGDAAGARAAIAALESRSATQYVPPFNLAMVYAGLGERERCLDWLERAVEDRDVRLTFLRVEPKWDPLRADPRFQAVSRRLGLAPPDPA